MLRQKKGAEDSQPDSNYPSNQLTGTLMPATACSDLRRFSRAQPGRPR